MSTRVTTRPVRYLGACKACKAAGRPCGVRVEAMLTMKRTEIARRGFGGVELAPKVTYSYAVDCYPAPRLSDPNRISVDCPRCSARVPVRLVRGVKTEEPCGARCLSATGHSCECSCAGSNHGAGVAA